MCIRDSPHPKDLNKSPALARFFLFAGVVVRDIGHGTQGDLELLQEDLSDEGFKVITFS